MFEGPKPFGEEDDAGYEEPFDYIEHAQKLREEREALEATKKAERLAKESEREAEKKARVTKKLADKAQEKLDKKTEKLEDASAVAKDEIAGAQKEASELKQVLDSSQGELPAPVEMTFSEGSEYVANLQEGEEAIFDLNNSIEKISETVIIADEVTEQADALARARAALESVDAAHMGASHEGQEDNTVVFGETGPQDDVRDRLRHAWETPSAGSLGEPTVDAEAELPSPVSFEDAIHTVPTASALEVSSTGYSTEAANAYSSPFSTSPVERAESIDPVETSTSSRIGARLRGGKAFVGGLIAGRSIATKNKLESVNRALAHETKDLQREIRQSQVTPTATRETGTPVAFTQTAAVRQVIEGTREIRGTNEPAIPAWISQIKGDVEKGRVPELKKWQLDVLRAQHPDLLKKYESLDGRVKENIKLQSKESIKGVNKLLDRSTGTANSPGSLPTPAYSMPAYMKPTELLDISNTPTPAYEYDMDGTSSNGSVFSSQYLTIVAVGGVLFGAVLIIAFGL